MTGEVLDGKRTTLLVQLNRRTAGGPKLDGVAAFLVLFKSCVGLGIFSYPYAYGKAGSVYGGLLSVFVCYITTYGMYRLTIISSEIEKDTNEEVLIDDYHFLSEYVAERYGSLSLGRYLGGLAVAGTILNNVSIIIASIIEVSTHLEEFLKVSDFTIKCCILGFYLAVTTYAIKPEMLRGFSMASGFIIITVAVIMFSDNLWLLLKDNQKSNLTHEMFNLHNTGLFLGMAGFAYEACGTIFTVRMSMKDPHKTPRYIVYVFSFIGSVFVLFSLSFYFAYGVEGLKPVAFEFYPQETKPFLYIAGVIFCLCLVMFVPMFNISDSDLLEHYDFIGRHLRDSDGNRSTFRLVVFRCLLFILSAFPAFVTNKVELVMGLEGSVVIPFISFFIPVTLNYLNEKSHGRPITLWHIIHDSFIFLCGIAIFVLGLTYSIQDIIQKTK